MQNNFGSESLAARSRTLVLPLALIVLLLLFLLSLRLGRYPLSVAEIVKALFTRVPSVSDSSAETASVIVRVIRLPRVLLSVLSGMALALSGAAMQGVFRNPLVGPEIAGVSSGASFGGVLAILLAWPLYGTVSSAFACGMLALLAAYLLARISGQGRILALVLSGIIVGSFFSSLIGLVELAADPDTTLPAILYWLLGSFSEANYTKLAIMAVALLTAGTALIALRWRLNLLSLGETDSAALGVNLAALRWCVISLAAFLVAVQVSVSGGVSWVGLIMPHIARMLVGPEHSRMLPVAALLGGIYLLAMDDLSRMLRPQEIPIGLLTAIVGAPVFAFLFWRTQGRGWSEA